MTTRVVSFPAHSHIHKPTVNRARILAIYMYPKTKTKEMFPKHTAHCCMSHTKAAKLTRLLV